MESKITVDELLRWLREMIEKGVAIPPHDWIESAARLNILVGDETARLYHLKQAVSKFRADLITKGDNVSKAKSMVEAMDEYRDMKILEGKIKVIEESVRIAKLMARTSIEEARGNV